VHSSAEVAALTGCALTRSGDGGDRSSVYRAGRD
jgi:hypothetical protein